MRDPAGGVDVAHPAHRDAEVGRRRLGSLDQVPDGRRVEHDPAAASLEYHSGALEDVHLPAGVAQEKTRGQAADRPSHHGGPVLAGLVGSLVHSADDDEPS